MARRPSGDDLGIPQGLSLYTSFPFAGMNQSASRPSIRDQEFYHIENWVRVGDGYLRTLWDVGTPIYTAPSKKAIISAFFYNIAITQYVIVFLNDGTAFQVDTATGSSVAVSSVGGTFYTQGGSIPGCIQWGSQYLLIGNNNTQNSYWIWDGSILYSAGTLSPEVTITDGGAGYSFPPTVTAYGGEGSGATFSAVVENGVVVAVNIVSPGSGYQPVDIVQLAFSSGGASNSAILEAVMTARSIQSIIVTAGGNGYTSPPTVVVTGGGGTGVVATANLTGTSVSSVSVTNGGTGFTSTPTISFTGGGGSGAEAYASVPGSSVSSINIISGGSGYGTTPLLTIVGGGGTGATATATLTNGVITSTSVTNGGSNYTSTPAVTVETAVNSAAAATVGLMPFGISGTTLEAFQSRVWIANAYTPPTNEASQNNANKFFVSAPDSVSDFATSDGGLIFTATDRFLRQSYIAMRQSNGYLYPIGDSSCSIISGVATMGVPPSTTFSYQNTDPQIGTPWRDSCQDFGRNIIFANELGVYALYGGSVTKISQVLDPLFSSASFPPTAGALTPTSADANIFGGKYYCLLLTILDDLTLTLQNKMIVWDQQEWFLASQSINLIFIATQEINSNLTAWGSDGNSLYPLFQTPNKTITKTLATKLFGGNQPFLAKQVFSVLVQGENYQTYGQPVSVTLSLDTETNGYPVGPTPLTFSVATNLQISWPMAMTGDIYAAGIFLGLTMTTTQPDMVLNYLAITYTPGPFQVGSINLVVPGQY
jgi:hypothetical protein